MYIATKWRDRIVDPETGEVRQQGTPLSAGAFNNLEHGIQDAAVAQAILLIAEGQTADAAAVEEVAAALQAATKQIDTISRTVSDHTTKLSGLESGQKIISENVNKLSAQQQQTATGLVALGNEVEAQKGFSTSLTLAASGWTASGSQYTQTVAVAGIKTTTPIIFVDAELTVDNESLNTERLTVWGSITAFEIQQGDGSLTFYCSYQPTIDIPVKAGVA